MPRSFNSLYVRPDPVLHTYAGWRKQFRPHFKLQTSVIELTGIILYIIFILTYVHR